MRVFLLAAFLVLGGQTAPVNGTITGRVLLQGTSDPISDVQVSVRQSNLDRTQSPPRPIAGVLTGTDGSFSFKELPPGRYNIEASRDGYFAPRIDGFPSPNATKTINVDPGKTTEVEPKLEKGGAITGRVRNPLGQPVAGISVTANETAYPLGRETWAGQSSKTTDDRGEYRLAWLPPGDYFIGVTPRPADAGLGPQDSWAKTFYPGVTDPDAAMAVSLKSGGEVAEININIQLAETMFKISGTAVNPLPNLRANAQGVVDRSVSTFFLVPMVRSLTDGVVDTQWNNTLPASARTNNEFEIRNVKPGTYNLYTGYVDYAVGRYYTSRTPINVRNGDVTGLSLAIEPGVHLAAELVVEGSPSQSIKLEAIRLRLTPKDTLPGIMATVLSNNLQFDPTGKLVADNVPEAKFAVALIGLPKAGYVADVRQGGVSVFDDGFVLTQKLNPIQIIVRTDGSSISGIVETPDKKPTANATVVLAPAESRRMNATLFRTATSDDTGRFAIQDIEPGTYTIFTWYQHPFREPWLNADYLAKFKDTGKTTTLLPNSSTELALAPENPR